MRAINGSETKSEAIGSQRISAFGSARAGRWAATTNRTTTTTNGANRACVAWARANLVNSMLPEMPAMMPSARMPQWLPRIRSCATVPITSPAMVKPKISRLRSSGRMGGGHSPGIRGRHPAGSTRVATPSHGGLPTKASSPSRCNEGRLNTRNGGTEKKRKIRGFRPYPAFLRSSVPLV